MYSNNVLWIRDFLSVDCQMNLFKVKELKDSYIHRLYITVIISIIYPFFWTLHILLIQWIQQVILSVFLILEIVIHSCFICFSHPLFSLSALSLSIVLMSSTSVLLLSSTKYYIIIDLPPGLLPCGFHFKMFIDTNSWFFQFMCPYNLSPYTLITFTISSPILFSCLCFINFSLFSYYASISHDVPLSLVTRILLSSPFGYIDSWNMGVPFSLHFIHPICYVFYSTLFYDILLWYDIHYDFICTSSGLVEYFIFCNTFPYLYIVFIIWGTVFYCLRKDIYCYFCVIDKKNYSVLDYLDFHWLSSLLLSDHLLTIYYHHQYT